MALQKIYGSGEYLIDSAVLAYWDMDDYNLYAGNDYSSDFYHLRGSVAGENYSYIYRAKYHPSFESATYRAMQGYVLPSEDEKGCYRVIRCNEGDDGLIHSEDVGYLTPRKVYFQGRNYSGFDVFIWRPQYSGWAWCAFADAIPGAAGAYVLLMWNDITPASNDLWFQGHHWRAGERKPSVAPEEGTRWTWTWDDKS